MDDLAFGMRNKRGDWRPNGALQVGPLFDFQWSPMRVLKWLPGYFLPSNVVFMAVGPVFWFFLTPARETLQTFSWDWALLLLLRNSALVLLFYGALELRLYVKRSQGSRFKFNSR